MLSKLFNFIKLNQADIVLGVCVILITLISFQLGQLYSRTSSQGLINIIPPSGSEFSDNSTTISTPKIVQSPKTGDLRVFASKASKSRLYHYSWCAGASQIAEKNKITFQSAREAEMAGYTRATNCK